MEWPIWTKEEWHERRLLIIVALKIYIYIIILLLYQYNSLSLICMHLFSLVFYGTRSVHVAFTCNIVWNRARYNCMCGHGMLCTCAFKAIASWYCCLIFQVMFTKVINKKFGVRSNILSVHMYSHQLNTGSHLNASRYSCILPRHLYQDRQYGSHLLHTILPLIMPCHVSYSGSRAVQCSLQSYRLIYYFTKSNQQKFGCKK